MVGMRNKHLTSSRVAPFGSAARGALLGGLTATALLAGCGGGNTSAPSPAPAPSPATPAPPAQSVSPTMLKTDGTRWVDADGKQVLLKGTNLGNWLVQEFWMMGQGG